MKGRLMSTPYIIWMAVFIFVPLIIVLYYAFTDSSGNFTFDNLSQIQTYFPVFIKSVWMAAVATVICLVLAYPLAYFVSTMSPRWQKFLIMLVMLPMCMSFLLRTLALETMLLDNGIINNMLNWIGLDRLPLIRNSFAVIVGMVYNYIPFMIIPIYTVLSKTDNTILEAAQDLGANKLQVFGKIILPMSISGIVTGVTMVFVPAVSTFYISKKLGDASSIMIGDVIETQFLGQGNNVNLGAAMSLILMIMVFVCIGIMNRFTEREEDDILL